MHLNPQAQTLAIRVLVTVAAIFAGWTLLGVYTVGPSYAGYVSPTHAFLRAALTGDSADLARQGAEPAVVSWAMHAGRQDTASLRALERGLYLRHGAQKGDTAVAWFGAWANGRCAHWSLRMFFVGRGDARRIGKVEVYCSTPVIPPPGAKAPIPAKPA
jgi:hypothetical protein